MTDLLIRAALGGGTPAEQAEFRAWVVARADAAASDAWKAAARAALRRHIVDNADPVFKRSRVFQLRPGSSRSALGRVAVIATLLGAAALGAYAIARSAAISTGAVSAAPGDVTARRGQRIVFRLPDGTVV